MRRPRMIKKKQTRRRKGAKTARLSGESRSPWLPWVPAFAGTGKEWDNASWRLCAFASLRWGFLMPFVPWPRSERDGALDHRRAVAGDGDSRAMILAP